MGQINANVTIGLLNPISTVIFVDACVSGGRGPVGPPLKMAFLLQKCTNFGPELSFDKILARFLGMCQNFSLNLTIFEIWILKSPCNPTFLKIELHINYIPQKKAEII